MLPPEFGTTSEGESASQRPTLKFSGNGFVAGTVWSMGFNVENADPALVAKEHEMLEKEIKLAGPDAHYSAAIDFKRYNFAIGIAESTTAWQDILYRVWGDNFTTGQLSAAEQVGYAALRGRQFDHLGCHSNGAMICLAAIYKGDVVANHVTL
jgi:hypothetical protein